MHPSVYAFIFVTFVTQVCSMTVPKLTVLLGEVPMIGSVEQSTEPSSRLAGSKLASRAQFPHQAYVIADNLYLCSGSIISINWVLTSGLCTHARTKFQVYLGTIDISASDEHSRTFLSGQAIVHEDFNQYTYQNDIGLIRIPHALHFNAYIKTVRLPNSADASNTYEKNIVSISGWGKVCGGSGVVKNLRYIETKVISNSQCLRTYSQSYVSSSKFCTFDADGKGIMSFDSGDPVVMALEHGGYRQIGIASAATSKMCEGSFPSVHTKLASYVVWIREKTGIPSTT